MMENAILSNEIMIRMRGRRTFVIATLYALLLSALVLLVWLGTAKQSGSYGQAPFESAAGRPVFMTIMIAQICLVSFIAPALTASCITGEKERRSFDLLATSLIGSIGITFGKLLSAAVHLLVLIAASLPLVAVCFLFGGISPAEVAEGYLVLIATTLTYAVFGLFWSARSRNTIMSVGFTYGTVFLLTAGTYLAAIMCLFLTDGDEKLSFVVTIGNPFVAMTSVLYGNEMFGPMLAWLKAPIWCLTVAGYALLCLILIPLTIAAVRRAMRQA